MLILSSTFLQIIKAMRDAEGNRLPNAHIIAVYHRLCKLLFYNVKPIVVFDGEVPEIKRRTCAKRRALKTRAADSALSQKEEKVKLSLQQLAVAHVAGKPVQSRKPAVQESPAETDMFYLAPSSRETNFLDEEPSLQHTRLGNRAHFDSQASADPYSDEFR